MRFRQLTAAVLLSLSLVSVAFADMHDDQLIPAHRIGGSGPGPGNPGGMPPFIGNPMDPERKGTIGLVCIDESGVTIPWYDNGQYNAGAFEDCIRGVVNKWNRFYDQLFQNQNPYSTQPSQNDEINVNQFLGGYSKFWDLSEPVRKSSHRRHNHWL